MDLMAILATIPGIGPYLPAIASAIALASALAPFVPPSAGPFYVAVNFVAMNFRHARNASNLKVKK